MGANKRIPIAADHAGFELKQRLIPVLRSLGYEVEDLGTDTAASSDYPDYAHPLAQRVSRGEAERGILSAAPGSGCRTSPNAIRIFGRRWCGSRR